MEFLSAELSSTLCVRGVIGEGFKAGALDEPRDESSFKEGRPIELFWYTAASRLVCCSSCSSGARLVVRDVGTCWSDIRRATGGGDGGF